MEPLRLIPWHTRYTEDMARLLADDEVRQYLDLPGYHPQDCALYMRNAQAMEAMGLAVHRLLIVPRNTLIGAISLLNIDSDAGTAEMGTWLGRAFWGRGYNRAAKEKMLHIAFAQLHLRRVFLITRADNLRSLRALAKLEYVTLQVNDRYPSYCQRLRYRLGREIILSEVTRETWQRKKTRGTTIGHSPFSV